MNPIRPQQLHASYLERHAHNPLKTKLLELDYVDLQDPFEKEGLLEVLRQYQETSEEDSCKCCFEALCAGGDQKKYLALKHEEILFEESAEMFLGMIKGIQKNTCSKITTVMDANQNIQAISLSRPNLYESSAWKVGYLATAPHNIRGMRNGSPQVEGAGSSLIEEAIAQAVIHQGIEPSSLEAVSKVAVVLRDYGKAQSFYDRLHFDYYLPVHEDDVTNRILHGKNIVHFLEEYGGRIGAIWDRQKKEDVA